MTRTRAWRWAAIWLALALMIPASVLPAAAGDRLPADPSPAGLTDTIPPFLPGQPSLQFGGWIVGSTSPARSVTFLNTTPGTLTAQSVALAGLDAADFDITADTCTGNAVAAGATCQVHVTFTPGALGGREASVALSDATPAIIGSSGLDGTGQAASAVSWGTTHPAGASRTWSYGSELARTTTSSANYLHAVYTTNRVGGKNVTDHGPYLGVYYIRSSSATGATWSSRVRLNPARQHGDQAVIAASGRYVYGAWISQTKYIHYSPSAPRALYFRVNAHHGSGSWRSVKRLTSATGRVSTPDVAASGGNVYVAYTDANTGSIRLKISRDHGSTWHAVTLGSTTRGSSSGRNGIPSIAVSGSNVIVAWVSNGAGDIKARESSNSGSTWQTPGTLAQGARGAPATAALGGRVAVAWPTSDGVALRTRFGGSWSGLATLHPPANGKPYVRGYGVAIALNGSARVGVAWTACWQDCVTGNNVRTDLVWAESATEGLTWFGTQVVGPSSGSLASRVNDAPAIVWPTAGRRAIVWNGWTLSTGNYRLYVRTAAGNP